MLGRPLTGPTFSRRSSAIANQSSRIKIIVKGVRLNALLKMRSDDGRTLQALFSFGASVDVCIIPPHVMSLNHESCHLSSHPVPLHSSFHFHYDFVSHQTEKHQQSLPPKSQTFSPRVSARASQNKKAPPFSSSPPPVPPLTRISATPQQSTVPPSPTFLSPPDPAPHHSTPPSASESPCTDPAT